MAQVDISTVDLKKIEQKKVRSFLKQQSQQIKTFSDLEVSATVDDNFSGFKIYEKSYLVKENIDFVWDIYRFSCQTDVWDLNKISFALLYNSDTESLIYSNQECIGLQSGQIFYLNLKIMHGFYNLPVAFEIVDVDPKKSVIKLSYFSIWICNHWLCNNI